MANFVNVENLIYCGKYAQEIMVKELYESNLRGYGFTYMPGVKYKQELVTGEVGNLFQAYTCPFSPSGDVVLSQSWITPVVMKVNLEECYDAFWDLYMGEQTEISLNGGIPQMFFEWFFQSRLLVELRREYEDVFFNGDTAYSGSKNYLKLADGLIKQMGADAKTKHVQATAFTVDNILTQVEAISLMVPEDVVLDDYKIFMNINDVRVLKAALGKNSPLSVDIWSNFTREGERVYVNGFEVVPTLQARNSIIMGPAKNIVLGYDVADSEVQYKLIDMRETTLDNTFRVGVITNIAIGYAYPELFVVSTQTLINN